MSLLLALLLAADDLPLGTLPKQALPASGCAAFLWSGGEQKALIAMATAEPGQLRLLLNGTVVDLARGARSGGSNYGLFATTDYAAPGVQATLDIKTEARGDLVKGGVVSEGTLRLERDGQDGIVVPVTGLVGCS
jgi:hypothetical protein